MKKQSLSNMVKPVLAFVLVNALLGGIFFSAGINAWVNSNSRPVKVWGNWTNIDTLHLNCTQANTDQGKLYGYNVFTYSVPELPDLANLTFVSSTVNIHINFSKIATFGIGYALMNETWPMQGDEQEYFIAFSSDAVVFIDDGVQPTFSLNTSSLDESQTIYTPLALQIPRYETGFGNYPIFGSYPDFKAINYTIIAGWPCFFWNGNGSVNVDYVETYKYTPLDHTDTSRIDSGKAILAALPSYIKPLAICDLVVGAVLVGIYHAILDSKKEKEKQRHD